MWLLVKYILPLISFASPPRLDVICISAENGDTCGTTWAIADREKAPKSTAKIRRSVSFKRLSWIAAENGVLTGGARNRPTVYDGISERKDALWGHARPLKREGMAGCA
jgi:hypothetical protein